MAFSSFGNTANPLGGGAAAAGGAIVGPDLETIQTEVSSRAGCSRSETAGVGNKLLIDYRESVSCLLPAKQKFV
jgi:hypothetical protein